MRAAWLMPLVFLCAAACEQAKAPPVQTSASTVASAVATTRVAKIVFIDKQEACDCTRKRIDDTWAALQSVLGPSPTLPVERIHVDTQAAQAEAYTLLKPLMVPPGIYFVDAHDAVVEMLQGEVKAEQVTAVLKGK
jgi:hypothetical protein